MEFRTGLWSRGLTCQMRDTAQGLFSCCSVAQSWLTLCHHMDCSPARLLCPWDFPGKNTGVGCHLLLQEIFPTQGLNPSLLPWQVDSLPLSHLGSLKIQDTRLKMDVETSSDRRETCPGLQHELRDVSLLSWRHSASTEMLARALGRPRLSRGGRGLNNYMTHRRGQMENKRWR